MSALRRSRFGRCASATSASSILGSNGVSLVSLGGLRYFGSEPSAAFSHFLMVLRVSVVRLAISLIDKCSRKNIRRILAYMTMVITSLTPAYKLSRILGFTWSKFNAHKCAYLVSFKCASTDVTLSTLSSLVKAALRDLDVIARYGGEEFLVICTNTDVNSAALLAERLRQLVESHPIKIPDTSGIGQTI